MIISPCKKRRALHLKKLEFPSRMICAKFRFWRRKLLKFVNVFSQFRNYLPLWKGAETFIWTNLNPLHPKTNCAKFGWNWPTGSGEEDLKHLSMYFRNFVIISPWKRARHFFWTNVNPLHPKKICAKFGWNWEEDENEKKFTTTNTATKRTTDN